MSFPPVGPGPGDNPNYTGVFQLRKKTTESHRTRSSQQSVAYMNSVGNLSNPMAAAASAIQVTAEAARDAFRLMARTATMMENENEAERSRLEEERRELSEAQVHIAIGGNATSVADAAPSLAAAAQQQPAPPAQGQGQGQAKGSPPIQGQGLSEAAQRRLEETQSCIPRDVSTDEGVASVPPPPVQPTPAASIDPQAASTSTEMIVEGAFVVFVVTGETHWHASKGEVLAIERTQEGIRYTVKKKDGTIVPNLDSKHILPLDVYEHHMERQVGVYREDSDEGFKKVMVSKVVGYDKEDGVARFTVVEESGKEYSNVHGTLLMSPPLVPPVSATEVDAGAKLADDEDDL